MSTQLEKSRLGALSPSRRRVPTPGEPFRLSRRGRAGLPTTREMDRAHLLIWVAAATLIGVIVRTVVPHGLSLEELENLDTARLPFGPLITHIIDRGVHPPLQPVLVWLSIHVFGDATFWARLPSLVAGILLIPATAWLAVQLFDRRTTVIAAALVAVAPILVWYSQDVSSYELVALFGTLSLAEGLRATRTGSRRAWVLYVVWTSVAVWADWSGWLVVLASQILVAAQIVSHRQDRARLRTDLIAWGLAAAALACQFIPLGVLLADQVNAQGGLQGVATVGASSVSFYSAVSNFGWALFGFQPSFITSGVSAVWPLAMLASLVFIGRDLGNQGRLLLVCGLVPAIGVLVLGLVAPGSFDVRYGIAGIPALVVLAAHAASSWPRSQLGRTLTAGALLVILVVALADQELNPSNPRRYDFAPAFAQIHRDARAGSTVLLEPGALRLMAQRDAPGLRTTSLTRALPDRAQAASVFVVTSFTGRGSLWALRNREIGALRATRHLVSRHSYPGVEVWWFR